MNLRGFRSWVSDVVTGKRKSGAPVIMTELGPVDEGARFQAAMNMLADPVVKLRVEEHFAKRLGSVAKGVMEARRRYPEAYPK